MTRMTGTDCAVMCNLINTHTHTQVSLIPPWEDQYEWHRMTRMTGPDYAVVCNLINTHTHTHTMLEPFTHFITRTRHVLRYRVDPGSPAGSRGKIFKLTSFHDAAAELGKNSVRKHQIQPEYGEWPG